MSESTLLVMRHAKSSWKDGQLSDHQRPLNSRGRKAAPLMAQVLADRSLVPQLVISSTAVRAQQTVELMLPQWSQSVEIVFEDSLYLAHPRSYLNVIADHCSDQQRVMVVGHNPGLEYLIEYLTGTDEVMSTGAIAIMTTQSPWNDLEDCQLLEVLRPKEV